MRLQITQLRIKLKELPAALLQEAYQQRQIAHCKFLVSRKVQIFKAFDHYKERKWILYHPDQEQLYQETKEAPAHTTCIAARHL
eukprot:jgi/Pico_ML_1/54201/g4611.t1